MILDGKTLSEQIAVELKQLAVNKNVNLSVIIVGSDPDSVKYVRAKQKRAHEIGVACDIVSLPEDVSEEELLTIIDGLNDNPSVNGVMIQLPLPKHLDQSAVTRRIDPDKDVDGLNPRSGFMPATVRGIERLLEHYLFGAGFDLDGRVAVVVGRGEATGKPTAQMLLDHDATVIVCHEKTKDLAAFTRQADILVVAVGHPNLITPAHVKDGAVIIDVGTEGDVAKECHAKASAYTPVPGGVGPMTVVSLIENTIRTGVAS